MVIFLSILLGLTVLNILLLVFSVNKTKKSTKKNTLATINKPKEYRSKEKKIPLHSYKEAI